METLLKQTTHELNIDEVKSRLNYFLSKKLTDGIIFSFKELNDETNFTFYGNDKLTYLTLLLELLKQEKYWDGFKETICDKNNNKK